MARTKEPKHRLKNVVLHEVSLVGKGDNPAADVMLLKTKPQKICEFEKGYDGEDKNTLLKAWYDDNISDILKDCGCSAETFDEMIQDRELREELWDMIWTLQDSINSIINDDTVTDKESLIATSVSQFQQAVSAILNQGGEDMTKEELEKALAEEQAKTAELTKKLEEVEKAKAEPNADGTCKTCGAKVKKEEEIDKSALPENVRKHLEEQEAINKANAEEINKLKDANVEKECIEKAQSIPAAGAVSDISGVLKDIRKHDASLSDKVFGILKAVNARIVEAGLFKESGKTGEGEEVTALAKMNKAANEMVAADATGKTTFAVAFDKIYTTNHELRKAYIAETR